MLAILISYEKEALDPKTGTYARLKHYTKNDLEISVIVLSGGYRQNTQIHEEHFSAQAFAGSAAIRLWRAWKLCSRIIQEYKGAIILSSQDPFITGLFGFLMAKKHTLPIEIQEHGDFFSGAWRRDRLSHLLWEWIGLFLLRRADHVRAVSERVKTHLIARNIAAKHISILPVAQQLEELSHAQKHHSPHPDSTFNFVMPCRWTKQKGLDIALKAMHLLRLKNTPAHLTIIGRGELEQELRDLIRRLDLKSSVTLVPWQPLTELWSQADGLIIASRWEGWCRTIPEAMATHTSIITTPVGCVGSFFRPGTDGLIIPLENPSALADAIEETIHDNVLRQHRMIAAYERSKTMRTLAELQEEQRQIWKTLSRPRLHTT